MTDEPNRPKRFLVARFRDDMTSICELDPGSEPFEPRPWGTATYATESVRSPVPMRVG
jgi:hypothetical protein